MSTLQKIYLDTPTDPTTLNRESPKWLGSLILECLAKEPAQRPATSEIVVAFKEQRHLKPSKFSYQQVLVSLAVISLTLLGSLLFYEIGGTAEKGALRLVQFEIPPKIINRSEIRVTGQISLPQVQFKCGSLTGVSDSEGRIEGRVTLPEGKNVLSLQVLQEQEWIALKSVSVQVDTQKPKIHVVTDFGNVCVLEPRQAITMTVEDETSTEWKIAQQWRKVNSNKIKLYASESNIHRTIEVRDSAGHSTKHSLFLVSKDHWRRIQQSMGSTTLWFALPEKQKEMLALWIEQELGDNFQFEKMSAFGESKERLPIPVYSHKKTGMIFHLIVGGRYQMGTGSEEFRTVTQLGRDHVISRWKKARRKNKDIEPPVSLRSEMPAHSVSIKAFLLAEHECTEREWAVLTESVLGPPKNFDLPISNLSWEDINRALKSAQAPFRLPSEAEWEYACRATSKTQFYWGDDPRKDNCWHHKNSRRGSHSFKDHIKKRNRFGLIDMSGNIGEWCEDSFIRNYKDGPNSEAPRLVADSTERVIRGGSWNHGLGLSRSARRYFARQDQKFPYAGARFAVSLPKTK